MAEIKYFHCANDECYYHTAQPIENVAEEIDNYKLCHDCYDRGFRLKHGVIVYHDKGVVATSK